MRECFMHTPDLMSAWVRAVLLFTCPLDGSLGIEVKGSVHPSGSSFSPEMVVVGGSHWRYKDFLLMRCSAGTGQGLAAASAPSSP